MRARAFLALCLIVSTIGVGSARAEETINDDWSDATQISSFPFEASVDLTGTSPDADPFRDCLPSPSFPNTPLNSHYGDVWYRFSLAHPTVLMLNVEIEGGTPFVGIYRSSLSGPQQVGCDYGQLEGEPASLAFEAPGDVTYMIQVGTCTNCGEPMIADVHVFEPAPGDLAVDSIQVTRPMTDTPVAAVPHPHERLITLVLRNNSEAQGAFWRVKACDYPRYNEDCAPVAHGFVRLGPGEVRRIEVTWNTLPTASAGDFDICGVVSQYDHLESTSADNRRRTSTWVLASNTQGESYVTGLTGAWEGCYPETGYWWL
jgi:hypothetical protein